MSCFLQKNETGDGCSLIKEKIVPMLKQRSKQNFTKSSLLLADEALIDVFIETLDVYKVVSHCYHKVLFIVKYVLFFPKLPKIQY